MLMVMALAVAALLTTALLMNSDKDNPLDPAGEGASGSGLTHDGRFYWLSGAEVRPDAVGSVVAEDVPMMDFTTELRTVGTLDPTEVLAVKVPDSAGWRLVAADQDTGANPWADDEVVDVIEPEG